MSISTFDPSLEHCAMCAMLNSGKTKQILKESVHYLLRVTFELNASVRIFTKSAKIVAFYRGMQT